MQHPLQLVVGAHIDSFLSVGITNKLTKMKIQIPLMNSLKFQLIKRK